MATRATIIIKVPTEYKGKSINFDANKLHCVVGHCATVNDEWVVVPHDVKPRPEMQINSDYIEIYNHCDGYPQNLGEVLQKYFTTDEQVINLIAGGDLYCMCDDHYDAFIDNYPHIEDSLPKSSDHEPVMEQAFAYIWKDGVWYVKGWDYCRGDKWRKLSTVLKRLEKEEE